MRIIYAYKDAARRFNDRFGVMRTEKHWKLIRRIIKKKLNQNQEAK